MFVCSKCGNSDPRYIGYIKDRPYCRKCITFKGQDDLHKENYPKNASVVLNYELSDEQKDLSSQLLLNYKKGINTLVNAVCGSGKTEIVLEVISYAIRSGEHVAFALPRRDVAIELFERLKNIFKWNKVICVYGGHHDKLEADLIVLTTHQLYRYEKYFDLIILDEIDAFPFANNDTLYSMFMRSVRGHYVMLSATPSKETIKFFSKEGYQILNLNKRFHNFPLPVPEIIVAKKIFLFIKLCECLSLFLKETKQVFIFTPTIEICEKTYTHLKPIFKNGFFVHSKRSDRTQIIEDFRNKKYQFLVTTAVLERGVTVKDLQVIVFHAENRIYDSAALIQISGRAGRKKDAPEGRVIYLANEVTSAMEESINKIQACNTDL